MLEEARPVMLTRILAIILNAVNLSASNYKTQFPLRVQLRPTANLQPAKYS